MLEPLVHGDRFESLNRQAVELAVAARDAAAPAEQPVLVAGSISHTRPTRSGEWSPDASDVAKFEADCTEMAAIHKAAGCDLILAEMTGDPDFTSAIIQAAKTNGLPVWVGLSVLPQPDGQLGTYTNEETPLAEGLARIVAEGADVYGIMHSKPQLIAPALTLLRSHWSGPCMAYPDSLTAEEQEVDQLSFDEVIDEETFVAHCLSWRDQGVQILGGCCGLTVSHIAALTRRLAAGKAESD